MRKVINLNGNWFFVLDLDPEYHGVEYYKDPDGNRCNWKKCYVPSCWNKYGKKYSLFEGVVWYAKEFYLKNLTGKERAFLRFGGINYYSHIFLNGILVGEHEGGYTEFLIDVTGHIKKGKNVLIVRVDNRRNIIKLPAVMGWFNYGGIHRDVQLELSQKVRIENIFIDAFPEKNLGVGNIRINLDSADTPSFLKIDIKIYEPGGKIIWKETEIVYGQERKIQLNYNFQIKNPILWSPERPILYKCEVCVKDENDFYLDNLETNFGIRKLTIDGQSLLLNGKKIWIKGICYLYDHPSTGISFKKEIIKKDLNSLQRIGVNALRSHFPLPNMILDECDKRGLMLWIEVPVYCLSPKNDKKNSEFAQSDYVVLARQMLREMIFQAYNHPSVVFWSIGNECNTDHPEAKDFFKKLVEEIRKIDPHRLITYASLYTNVGCVEELVDVIGINEYWGWYDVCFKEIKGVPDLDMLEKELNKFVKQYKKVILMSEFGADAVPGFRSKKIKPWTENYQAYLLESTFKVIEKFPRICGAFPFLYNDYPDPSKPVNKYWKGLNLKGIVSYDRMKKIAFDAIKKIYTKKIK